MNCASRKTAINAFWRRSDVRRARERRDRVLSECPPSSQSRDPARGPTLTKMRRSTVHLPPVNAGSVAPAWCAREPDERICSSACLRGSRRSTFRIWYYPSAQTPEVPPAPHFFPWFGDGSPAFQNYRPKNYRMGVWPFLLPARTVQ